MLKHLSLTLFKLCGWKVEGAIPDNINQSIVIAGPHTSNFDFLFAMAGFYHLKLPVRYLIKEDWSKNILLKKIFEDSGALGVNRKKSTSMVDTLAELFKSTREDLHLMISPEGTRRLTPIWKTGFYHTARKANIPLVLSSLDYSKKLAVIGPSFVPTGCYKRDMLIVKNFYKDVVPKYPAKFSLQIHHPNNDPYAVCPI